MSTKSIKPSILGYKTSALITGWSFEEDTSRTIENEDAWFHLLSQ